MRNHHLVEFYELDPTATTLITPEDGVEFFYHDQNGLDVIAMKFNDSDLGSTLLLLTAPAAALVARTFVAMVGNLDTLKLELAYRATASEDE